MENPPCEAVSLGEVPKMSFCVSANRRLARRMLDDGELDAVVTGAPDHHHVQAALLACQLCLDAYCEEPLSLTIRQGRRLVEAVHSSGRVLQVGSQQRSRQMDRFASQSVREGGLGMDCSARWLRACMHATR